MAVFLLVLTTLLSNQLFASEQNPAEAFLGLYHVQENLECSYNGSPIEFAECEIDDFSYFSLSKTQVVTEFSYIFSETLPQSANITQVQSMKSNDPTSGRVYESSVELLNTGGLKFLEEVRDPEGRRTETYEIIPFGSRWKIISTIFENGFTTDHLYVRSFVATKE